MLDSMISGLMVGTVQAIDLMDEAAARLKMEATSKPEALDALDRKVSTAPPPLTTPPFPAPACTRGCASRNIPSCMLEGVTMIAVASSHS